VIVDVDVDLVFDGAVDVSATFDGPSTSRRPKDTT